MDSGGNVYVADTGSHTIRKITLAGVVTTFAGKAGTPGATDGAGSLARFNVPTALAVDTIGNVYVADNGNHTIRKITSAGAVTTLAGTTGVSGNTDGPGSSAQFSYPQGIAVDGKGDLFISDAGTTIRKITAAGVVTVLAGLGLVFAGKRAAYALTSLH